MKTNYGEFKIVSLRETAPSFLADQPSLVSDYFRKHVATADHYDPDVEQMVVILMNARHRIIGHHIAFKGTLDQVLAHPREIFRPAIVGNAKAIIIAHNHPTGDPTPSEPDIRVTRSLVSAGKVVMINVLDHIVVGDTSAHDRGYCSMRESGLM